MSGPVEMGIYNDNLGPLENLDVLLRQELEVTLPRIGLDIEATAVGHIENQGSDLVEPWRPLNKKYKKWKESKGYSTNIYTMTSSYVQAITTILRKEQLQVDIGVMRDYGPALSGHEDNLSEIAQILEYGTEDGRIPPRPLWRPTYEAKKRMAQTMIGLAIRKAIKRIEAAKAAKSGPVEDI